MKNKNKEHILVMARKGSLLWFLHSFTHQHDSKWNWYDICCKTEIQYNRNNRSVQTKDERKHLMCFCLAWKIEGWQVLNWELKHYLRNIVIRKPKDHSSKKRNQTTMIIHVTNVHKILCSFLQFVCNMSNPSAVPFHTTVSLFLQEPRRGH